ncbi:hypothetical protein [Xanthomonas hortorum]|nr:hypothetical protein [Xanthomonas hortorum]UXN01313.1 hypothetical protein N8D55_07465 [Xanthomonas hortorum pv. pelargonii]
MPARRWIAHQRLAQVRRRSWLQVQAPQQAQAQQQVQVPQQE